MTKKRFLSAGWSLWLLWTIATALGFTLGIGLSQLALTAMGEILSSIAFGSIAGLAQWFILRKRFHVSGWWVLATSLGATLGLVATNAVHEALMGVRVALVVGVLGLTVLGLLVGIAQWLVLRKHLHRAGWWVLASAAGWFLGGLIAWAIRLQFVEFVKILADFAILGIIAGASTGLGLLLFKDSSDSSEDIKSNPIANLAIASCAVIVIGMAAAAELSGRYTDDLGPIPDLGSVPMCNNLPPLDCVGDDSYCGEVVPFQPTTGTGYINYPVNDETWDDQYRSFIGRDLMMLIKYASAKVACETESWDYSSLNPLGLGDMSEVDGAIPGTSVGHPDHPWGTHQEGRDIDVAYFQIDPKADWLRWENNSLGMEGNLLQPVCKYTRFGTDVFHCTEPPTLLDPWRTALFIASLAESSNLRVIGVDGKVGPILEAALDQLVQSGWIDADLREQIPLAYEVTPEGLGWFKFHNHHMHISMNSK